jgi:thiamine pyrophosphokinase
MKKCIILANGQPPQKSVIKILQKKGFSTLICADGGANTAYRLKIIPDFIIGDLDSINKKTLEYFKGKSEIIKIKRQNDTDVEKCLKYAINKNIKEVILLSATGDRLDHSFCNLGIVLKFFEKIKIQIIHQQSFLSAYAGTVRLRTIPGEIISIYGFDDNTKIKSSGLKYPLKNISLPFGIKESTSNIANAEEIILKIDGGIIFVIRQFKVMKKYGFI